MSITRKERNARWAAANPEKKKLYNSQYAKAHRPRMNEINKLSRWRREGIEFPTRAKPAVCDICNRKPSKRGLFLDHCHLTGMFRGWLCDSCNRAIGLLHDSSDTCISAARYLRSWELK